MSYNSSDYSDSNYSQTMLLPENLSSQLGESEYLPIIFRGIKLNTMGNTRKNPFFQLKKIAMDPEIPFYDRTQAARYMSRIPHKHVIENTIEAIISILQDDNYPIRERYFFFSNNEKYIKFDGHIVKACHDYYFTKFDDSKKYPLILRLLSAHYIYQTNINNELWDKARIFIIALAIDDKESVFIRSEAADILKRGMIIEDEIIGEEVIKTLGGLYEQNRIMTIYTNTQNAHNETISESVMNVVRNLANDPLVNPPKKMEEMKRDIPIGFSDEKEITNTHLYNKIISLPNDSENRKTKIQSAFNHILIYPAKYEGLCLCDILLFVWRKIQSQNPDIKQELEKRLMDELYDMDQTCGTGYLNRIVGTLTGFVQDEKLQIKMNVSDELRANIFARLSKNLRLLSCKDQDTILEEISSNTSEKETAKEFIEFCTVKEELKEEFVDSKLIDIEKFDKIYQTCVNDFIGITDKPINKIEIEVKEEEKKDEKHDNEIKQILDKIRDLESK